MRWLVTADMTDGFCSRWMVWMQELRLHESLYLSLEGVRYVSMSYHLALNDQMRSELVSLVKSVTDQTGSGIGRSSVAQRGAAIHGVGETKMV